VRRRPSESQRHRIWLWPALIPSSKLIHVSQATYTDDNANSEYPRLFNERFPPKPQTSRPPSAGAEADADEDEAAWLGNIIGSSTEAEGSWERVEPIGSGALTIQFGEALGKP
jgi:hypothetical protein